MINKEEHEVIDSLEFEVSNQELEGQSGAGWWTAIYLTASGRCGHVFTASFECTSNNVRCK